MNTNHWTKLIVGNKVPRFIKIALVIFGLAFAGGSIYAQWSPPPNGTPPNCPEGSPGCDVPINVSDNTQIKNGNLSVGLVSYPIGFWVYNGDSYLNNSSIGNSGSGYQEIGYNVGFTTTNDSYTYRVSDTAADIRFGESGGDIVFRTAPAGTAGNPLTLTERMRIDGPTGDVTIGGNVTANQFCVAGGGCINTGLYLPLAGGIMNAGSTITFNGNGNYGVGVGSASSNKNSIAVDTLETEPGGTLELNYYGGNEVHIGSSGSKALRAAIMYDGDNGGYYVDPASTSNLNMETANSISTGFIDFRYDGGDSGQGANSYGIFQEGGPWTPPYPDLRIAYQTGIKLGAAASYNGIRFYNDYAMSGLVMAVNDASTGGVDNVYIPFIAYVNRLRNQDMYDWNDANYYIDMNLSSYTNHFARNYGWSVREYDWNNPGYYTDLDNTSVLNSLYANQFVYSSDISLKKDVKTISSALEKVLHLRGVEFTWKADNTASVGLVAQEVESVFPELVHAEPQSGLKAVQYGNLVGPLVEAVRELKAENDDLRARVERLEARN